MKKAIRIGIAIICMVSLVVGYYTYLVRRNDSANAAEEVELSEVQAILSKDFENDYPVTARSVVKWYNRIITAFYAEEFTDEELEALADQARCLLDGELLSYNPREDYINSLKAEIEDYHNRQKVIVSTSVSDSKEVQYATVNGDECAFVQTYYFVREGSTYTRTYEEFCLRRDNNNNWKILTWRLTDGDDSSD